MSHTAVQKFIDGRETPFDRTLDKVEAWLSRRAAQAARLEQTVNPDSSREVSKYPLQMGDLFDPDAPWMQDDKLGVLGGERDVLKLLRGIAPRGAARARKHRALQGMETTAAALGWTIPAWFFELYAGIDQQKI